MRGLRCPATGVARRGNGPEETHARPLRGGRGLQFEEAPGHDRHGRFRAAPGSSRVTDAIEEDDMTIEDEQGTEQVVAVEEPDVDAGATEVATDDDVEAHVWRAQS